MLDYSWKPSVAEKFVCATGSVKFFNEQKNFGFITPDDNSKDLFVHKNDIASGSLQEGDLVEFDSATGDKGLKAINVKKVS